MTLRNVAFVSRVPFEECSFKIIQEEHVITLDSTGAHMIDRRVRETIGHYVEATKVVRHANTPALAAAELKPVKPATSSVQQQQQWWVTPAATHSVSRQQGGMGQRHGFVSMVAAWEDIDMQI